MLTQVVQGSALYYQEHGTGFPVLLGRSYLWNASLWAPQIDVLSCIYRVIVPDLWGHGQSGPLPNGTCTLGDLAEQTSAFLDARGTERCAFVGLSVGGMWGARLALREPKRVRALVMIDTSLEAEPDAPRTRYYHMLDAIEAAGRIAQLLLDAIVPLFSGRAPTWRALGRSRFATRSRIFRKLACGSRSSTRTAFLQPPGHPVDACSARRRAHFADVWRERRRAAASRN
ncbi:alpha/beta fold hydrolase [Burkholderia sp. BCC1977]|uniref:alpha/beta fold hydrolase n=1 Tax=Burkholderia sp. BCC1977 TaxID=2817440 RepID=UPI002ABD382F|nr:alpha/beta fold hydrolase [Burkholderia sp. BCC1977]